MAQIGKIKFYNAGDKIEEPISFSLPANHGDAHATGRWNMLAPAASFFFVPTEIKLADGTRITCDFAMTIARKFGLRGVIMIDEEMGADDGTGTLVIPEEQPFAHSDEDAVEKGKEFWKKYLEGIANVHIEECQRARASGGFGREASGFTKRAFKLLGWRDPAAEMLDGLRSNKPQGAEVGGDALTLLAGIMAQLQAMNGRIQKLEGDPQAENTQQRLDREADAEALYNKAHKPAANTVATKKIVVPAKGVAPQKLVRPGVTRDTAPTAPTRR
jgi:hypothetical protein